MAQIHNTDLYKELKEGIKLQQLTDIVPTQLAEKVIAVMEVNPKLLRRSDLVKFISSSGTSATIYAIPPKKNFYLTALVLSLIKDVTATSVSTRIIGTSQGVAVRLVEISGMSLTVQDKIISMSFPFPVKLDADTNILLTNTTNTPNILCTGIVYGYHDDLANT